MNIDPTECVSLEQLERLTTPRLTTYIKHRPTAPQTVFLLYEGREALYGGAAGGGKSDALLMGALQYVDIPGYSALVLRKSYSDLSQPGALIPRAAEWLGGTGAKWNGADHIWRFPSGATLSFGYLETEADKYRYQSAEYQYIGFDELTQFAESQYTYLFSRLRRLRGSNLPLRMRSASNPGGFGHDWVKERFITHREGRRVFIPAKLDDNPYLDQAEYRSALAELDSVTRAQLLNATGRSPLGRVCSSVPGSRATESARKRSASCFRGTPLSRRGRRPTTRYVRSGQKRRQATTSAMCGGRGSNIPSLNDKPSRSTPSGTPTKF
jgi:hypothetical protein